MNPPLPRTQITRQREIARQQPYFDLLFVCVIVMLCASTQLITYGDSMARARLIEIPFTLSHQRLDVVEHLSLYGLPPGDALMGREKEGALREDVDQPSAVASMSQLKQKMESAGGKEPDKGSGKGLVVKDEGKTIYGISDGAPTAALVRPFLDRPMLAELRPAMMLDQPAVVMWLCGTQAPPAGFAARPAREPALPGYLLPLPCRGAP